MKILIDKPGSYEYVLDKEGQYLEIVGRFRATDKTRQEVSIKIVHAARHTECRTSLKAIVANGGFIKLDGTIVVETGAINTNSFLEERVLLLDETARATAVPNLEINNNEVKCSHAASVGEVDMEQLFYLMTKGLNIDEAKLMIADGFLS